MCYKDTQMNSMRYPHTKPRLPLSWARIGVRVTSGPRQSRSADLGSWFESVMKMLNKDTVHGRRIEMVALCPELCVWPCTPSARKMKDATKAATSSSSYSLTLISQWLHGESPVQSRLCADVRDVAKAHLAAGKMTNLQRDYVNRRYILSTERQLSSEATAQALMRGVRRAQKNHGYY
ncbi:LOW QUALITY PROTEIN: hypothetical protein ACHAW5_005737 [Stephanodiscus triporus]|uniref:Uncharacterized protein n=1 Tax=Stephanodiscus triporus TaxID=2934178 RepID=A0ABD3P1S9_9STRA